MAADSELFEEISSYIQLNTSGGEPLNRALRLLDADVLDEAVQAFRGNIKEAAMWFVRPASQLDCGIPLLMTDTYENSLRVITVLRQMTGKPPPKRDMESVTGFLLRRIVNIH